MVERVLVQQVRLIDEQDGEGAVSGEVLDVAGDGEKDIACRRAVGDGQGVAEMAIEVTTTEGDVVAVREPDRLSAERVSCGTQDTGLAHAGLAGDDGMLALLDALDEVAHDALLAGRQPELGIVDLLGKRDATETEVVAVVRHGASPSCAGFLPRA